jgi:predicted Ser/Thr protein kinase
VSVDALSAACLPESVLALSLTSAAGSSVRAQVQSHVDSCQRCREILNRMMHDETVNGEGPPAPPLPRVERGDPIGRYLVIGVAGVGGMGVVYTAYDETLDRKVAVKVLRPTDWSGVERREQVLREAQAMARVTHPNVVPIYEVGVFDGRIFIAMEFVDGGTLREWQRAEGRSWEEVISAYLAAGDGLFAAHRAGLVHRDFKPDNVLVGADGRPRVMDFGLARVETAAENPLAPGDASPHLNPQHSAIGKVIGTPAYMPPEQQRGEPSEARSDQFSFCVALYEALYGSLPFEGKTMEERTANIVAGAVRPVPQASPVPPPVERTLRRGMAANPADRFPSMDALLAALALDPRPDPSAASPAARLLLLAGMLMVLGGTVLVANMMGFHRSRPGEVLRLFQLGVVSLAVILTVAVLLRPRLKWNTFHWGLLKSSVVVAAQMAFVKWIAVCAGLDLRWTMAFDQLAFATGLAITAGWYLPGVWASVVLCCASSATLALTPRYPLVYAQAIYPLSAAWAFALWYRAARVRKARAESGHSDSMNSSRRSWRSSGSRSSR